jgi:DNA polymerase-3 subunit gamma/tau
MAYQVIARKWRPKRFDDVVGQQAVTRTLRNALASGRLAQAFVFAGPRGVGKTTTARILARALSCERGPTPDPCGSCDACVEIAEGRDIDVLEIDAATHTGVDNVREVIIAGLGIVPVRDRYKVFIIDEVHQLSSPSFNALLKSIEEPPPHVVFMMATTELTKIPETVRSRSQVYEFRAISTNAIADQLRTITDAEGITVADEALHLIARDADGSMRDAQSKLDQVLAFTGQTITPDDVAAVLGLVGRDLLLDAVQAVADEDAGAAFVLAGRAVELGYDLRLVCRELSRLVRDLLVLGVDASRLADPEIAGEGDRDRLAALASRFSREDLLRAFDLLSCAESDIRTAAQPRYHLEMALLKWIYLRKLVPIEDMIAMAASGAGPVARQAPAAGSPLRASAPPARTAAAPPAVAPRPAPPAAEPSAARVQAAAGGAGPAASPPATASGPGAGFKDAWLAEIRKSKPVFYSTVLAQAQKIDVTPEQIVFTFTDGQRALRDNLEQNRPWLETLTQQVSGRRVPVSTVGGAGGATSPAAAAPAAKGEDRKAALKKRALEDEGVQALLEVLPVEIRDVEEV